MMKTVIILLFALLGYSPTSFAQPSFSQIDTSVFAYVLGGLIIDGQYHLPAVHNVRNGLNTHGYLIKNQFGNTVGRDTTYASPDFGGFALTYRVDDTRFIDKMEVEPNFLFGANYATYVLNFDRSNPSSSFYVHDGEYLKNRSWAGFYESDSSIFHLTSTGSGLAFLKDIFWTKYDLDGNVISKIVLAEQKFLIPQTIVSTPDGNYLISYLFYSYGNSHRDTGYMKITSDGEVIWKKEEIEFGNGNDYNGIFEMTDNTFLRLRKTAAGFICKKIDLNGKVLRNIQLPIDFYYYAGNPFYVNPEGEFILLYRIYDWNNHTIHPAIAKYDPFGNLLWSKNYVHNPTGDESFLSLDLTDDGGFMLAGYSIDTTGHQRGWFMKTNCLGEVSNDPVGCNSFDCEDYPIDASFTTSDTLIDLSYESGTVYFENNSPNASSYLWNFKTGADYATRATPYHTFTENGVYRVELDVYVGKCHETAFQDVYVTNALSLDERSYDQSTFKLFPNPSQGNVVTIESDKTLIVGYQLCNGQGAIVGQESFATPQNKSELKTEGLSKGVYFVRLNLINGQQLTKKLVID